MGRGMERRGRPVKATLFFGNLAYDVGAPELKAEIERFVGRECVSSVRVASDQETGRMKGFAFVDLAQTEDADKIYTGMQGMKVKGRPLKIDDATRQ